MRESRKYLVVHKNGDLFTCTPQEIESNNSSGAEMKVLRVDEQGRVYTSNLEPTFKELFGEGWDSHACPECQANPHYFTHSTSSLDPHPCMTCGGTPQEIEE